MYWIDDDGLAIWQIQNAYIKQFTETAGPHDMLIINGEGTQAMVNIYQIIPISAKRFIDEYPNDEGVSGLINTYERALIRLLSGGSGRMAYTRESLEDDLCHY